MSTLLLTLEIRLEQDLVTVRQRARLVSQLLGFDALDQARVSTAVSEIARNALTYARGGTVEFLLEAPVERTDQQVLVVTVLDHGPGIRNLKEILSGATRSGMGIVSARRLVDTFAIDSAPGEGTVVALGKRLARGHAVAPAEAVRLARGLAHTSFDDPYAEIRRQNQELVQAMAALRGRQDELERLNRELEDTNRGVVALYAELDDKAIHLRQADELKTRFLSNMSHEFRTPLYSILALSRLLLDRVDGPLNDEQVKQLTFIRKSAEGLSELVNDLLDIAKVEAGRLDVRPSAASVSNLFGGLRGMFRPLLTNPDVRLVFEAPPAMPLLWTDEAKISQILRNFIANALKFTERGEVRVSAAHDAAAGCAVFAVADTGIGIAPEDQPRIFQEFTQLDSALQRHVRGTGLGLPLSQKLARLLGGTITVESAPGAGSTFRVSIPLVYGGTRPGFEASCGPDVTRFPVLVVEDDADAIVLYEKYLKRTGFQPLAAGTVQQARQFLNEIRPMAILLELLPEDGSWEFLAELKSDARLEDIPVLAVSSTDAEQRARQLGAVEFWTKPVARTPLLAALRRLGGQQPPDSILIVDDDELARYVLRELLIDTRYHVLEAANGTDGLWLAREHQPVAILLDLTMPGMTGFEVLERLRAEPTTQDLPVIVVTSKALDETQSEFLSRRAAAVISKQNLTRDQIVATVRRVLAQADAAGPAAPASGTEASAPDRSQTAGLPESAGSFAEAEQWAAGKRSNAG